MSERLTGLLEWLQALQWVRPLWLWALLALPLIAFVWRWQRRRALDWTHLVDAHLLPHLLVRGERRGRGGLVALLLAWLLAVLALAGPSWQQTEQPLWREQAPLVIVLDLSSRITATDVAPTRLLQARAKIARLLQLRQGGSVGLLVFADDAFTVAPLTEDAGNLSVFLDALAPDIMPRDGHAPERGVEEAVALLRQAGAAGGQILLITDGAGAATREAARRATLEGYQVQVLGVGSPAGAAYRQGNGEIGQAQLDARALQAVAAAGNGRYASLRDDEGDLTALGVLQPGSVANARDEGQQRVPVESGWWLLPPLMLLALLAFRRQRALAALLLALCLPWAGLPLAHAQAPERAQAPAQPAADAPAGARADTRIKPAGGSLWQRADQRDYQRMQDGVQQYRTGDAVAAERSFRGVETGEGWYNLGNALARQGRLDDAIAAYDRALELQPGMQDAKDNRAVVERARRQQSADDQRKRDGQQGGGAPSRDTPGSSPGSAPGNQGQPGNGTQDAGTPGASPQSRPPRDADGAPGQAAPGNADNEAQPGSRGATLAPPAQDASPEAREAQRRAQQQADQEQRQRMQQALQGAGAGTRDGSTDGATDGSRSGRPTEPGPVDPATREQQQAVEAWMRRVPDAPGELLRARFMLEDQRRKREGR